MGFIKTPKISVPEPIQAAPAQQEEPVKVEEVKESTAQEYNAKAKQRKTLLSTVLNKKNEEENSLPGSGTNPGSTTLRSTLG